VPAHSQMSHENRFVVTPSEINALRVCTTVPITSSESFTRNVGLAVPVSGHDTSGVAVRNQLRTFDIDA